MRNSAFFVLLVVSLLTSCTRDKTQPDPWNGYPAPVLPASPADYDDYQLPQHFLSGALVFFEYIPGNNETTDEGATLGRVLFYDKQLSQNRSISCGSCHEQAYAFSDPRQFSTGFMGEETSRQSMALFNKQFERRMFWDRRASNLENQVLQPLQDSLEMGMTMDSIRARIRNLEYYPSLFEAAFGDTAVTDERISRALAQFVRSIVSYQSKYDEGVESGFSNFTQEELLGKELFFNGETRCNQCHLTAHFYSPAASNNGLDLVYADEGAGNGMFKTPSLRNIELTAPYMHDGRFQTLEEVMEHYNGNIQPHPYLGDQLAEGFEPGGTPIQLNLDEYEVAAMIAFMKTLTDPVMTSDPKFSDPFPD